MTSSEHKASPSILMLVTSFHPQPMGGSEIQAFRLAKQLKTKGLNPYLIAIGKNGQSKDEVIEGIRVFRIQSFFFKGLFPSTSKSKKSSPVKIEFETNDQRNLTITNKKSILSFIPYFIFFLKIHFLIKKKKEFVDIIYSPMMEWTAFGATLLGIIHHKNAVIKDSTMNGITNLLRYPFGERMQRIICRNGYFVAMTNAIRKNLMAAGVAESRIFNIPNGVDLLERERGIPIDPNKFVFVGNLHQQPAKGVDILLRAWKKVISEKPAAKLYIIGGGHSVEYDEYVNQLGLSQNIIFLGKLTEFKTHLNAAVAFILPSRREGMSNALMEAMSLGMMCIATDISGSQDLIRDRVNGILVPVEDEISLAKAIIFACENPNETLKMGREARRTIENNYTFDIVSTQYSHLFKRLSDTTHDYANH